MTATIQLLLALGFGRTAALADLAITVVALAAVAVVLRGRRLRPRAESAVEAGSLVAAGPAAEAHSAEPEAIADLEHQPA
ncbi:MAG: hypothetical protein ABIS47_11645 [Acidimicrobiales bacterium]